MRQLLRSTEQWVQFHPVVLDLRLAGQVLALALAHVVKLRSG